MSSLTIGRRTGFALTLGAVAILSSLFVRNVSDASGSGGFGCSLTPNSRPTSESCRPAAGQSCYYCEYAPGGDYSVCYENGDGSIQFCLDYQTLPTD